MRTLTCDICGCSIVLDARKTDLSQTIAGTIPDIWCVVGVSKSVKQEEIIDLCPDCKEKLYDVRTAAQKTMDATVNAWLRMSLNNKKETSDGGSI